MKDLNYYKNLKYRMTLEYYPEDKVYFIKFPELPGCIADADTAEEAVKKGLKVKDEWLETAIKAGWAIPEPIVPIETSGRITVRTPKSLHEKLNDRAQQEGISLNQLILTYLAEGLERSAIQHHLEESMTSISQKINNLEREIVSQKAHAVIVAGAPVWLQHSYMKSRTPHIQERELWNAPPSVRTDRFTSDEEETERHVV